MGPQRVDLLSLCLMPSDSYFILLGGPRHPSETPRWYSSLLEWLFGGSTPPPPPAGNQPADKPRFTKLSSFKFRRELGKGAFGRVLLAESKADGKLYALKIISKKNMRHADKRQVMAERDILHAMAHSAPHPFTTGLKFAFQSQNNLYLGMEYLSGGNLKQLIQRFKSLPEVQYSSNPPLSSHLE